VTADGRMNRRAGSVGGVEGSTTDHTVIATLGYRL
jgi:hypothetical protein